MLPVKSDLCCGCGNCKSVCPKNCISMIEDRNGFIMPSIEETFCVNCGKCKAVCPMMDYVAQQNLKHTSYAVYAKNEVDRFNGSSGGVFGIAAKYILSEGGAIYGAAFDNNLQLKTTKAENEQALFPLYKSKYLQCDTNTAFCDIRKLLNEGKKILYTATPCQVQALKKYLGKDYDNLWTIDFLCHGVPSQKLFDLCRSYIEKKKGITIKEFQFRAKKNNGATPHYYKIKYDKNGKTKEKIELYLKSPFYFGFQKYISLRESCYQCPFAMSNRPGDITIGDFHSIDKYIKGINRFEGVSTLVLNTDKGMELWSGIRDNFVEYPVDFSILIENKELMSGPTPSPKGREIFWDDFQALPFEEFAEKHLNSSREWKKKLYYRLPKCARESLKKVLKI